MSVRTRACAVPLLAVAVLTAASSDAWAQRAREYVRESQEREQERRPSPRTHTHQLSALEHRALSDAVRRVERRTGGQVLSAEVVQFDGRDISRIKVVDASGRVRVYLEDPVTPHGPRRIRSEDN